MDEVTANSALLELEPLGYAGTEGPAQCKKIFMSVIGCLELLPRGAPAGDLFGRIHDLEPLERDGEGFAEWRTHAIGRFREKLWNLYPGAYIAHLKGDSGCPCRSTTIPSLGAMVGLIDLKHSPPDGTKKTFDQIKVSGQRIVVWLKRLPEGELFAREVMSRLHTNLEPHTWDDRPSASNSDGSVSESASSERGAGKDPYDAWRSGLLAEVHGQVWSRFPSMYTAHVVQCIGQCGMQTSSGIFFDLLKYVPKGDKRLWCAHAIEYLERRHNVERTDGNPWIRFVCAARQLARVEGFSEAYFDHIRTCEFGSSKENLCGSFEIFDAIASSGRPLSAEAMWSLLDGLNRPSSKKTVFRPQGLTKKEVTYIACNTLAEHIPKVGDQADRIGLMKMIINISAGLAGRQGTYPSDWNPPKSNIVQSVSTPAAIRQKKFLLSENAESIVQHVERRVWFFLQLCTVIRGDGYTYQTRGAWRTYCDTSKEGKGERAHSAMVSLVNRFKKTDKSSKLELGSLSLFNKLQFLKEINHTIDLPIKCNQVDSRLEGQLRKKKLEPLLNRVSGAKGEAMTPLQATVAFVRLLEAELLKLRNMGGVKQEYVLRHLHALDQLMTGENEARTVKPEFLGFCVQKLKVCREDGSIDFKAYQQALLNAETKEAKAAAAAKAAKAAAAAKAAKAAAAAKAAKAAAAAKKTKRKKAKKKD